MNLKSSARALFLVPILLLMLFAAHAWAQTPKAPADAPAVAPPAAVVKPEKDPFGRETPQGMVAGLMNALAAADYERAVRFFELDTVAGARGWPVLSGAGLARRFQQVLDRAGSITTPAELSNDPNGVLNDGMADDVERFGVVKASGGEVPLLAKHVKRDGKSLWLVSESTLSEIPALLWSLDDGAAANTWIGLLPEGPTLGGAPISHWISLLLAACLSLGLAWLLTTLHGPIERLIRRGGDETKLSRFVAASAGPLRLLIALLLFGIAAQALGVSVVARYRVLFGAQILGWLAVAWLLWRWADAASEVILGRMSRRGQLTAYSAISFLNRAFKALLGVLFLAALLRAFGVNVTAGLAALGVGGLAIALGAQKLFENLIGSLTLIADRPVRIGDFCRFGTTLGTIEEIGIRSTRIRTLDRTVLTVPNGEFSSMHIENYSQRDRFWFHPVLNLRYETSAGQMRHIIQALHAMLSQHPKVDAESARVRFIGLGAHSLDVEIFTYAYASDYSGFLEIQEELLLNCMEIVEASGTGFAFPSQTLYIGRDSGVTNNSRPRQTDDAVRRPRRERAPNGKERVAVGLALAPRQ
jgi:MscS family membrane protein